MGKISYIHHLRGVAAFFIVAIHFNLFTTTENLTGRLFYYFLSEWTAIFVLISGFLFQHLVNRYQPNKFFVVKFKNVILPYLIISLPAILVFALKIKSDHPWLDLKELYSHSTMYIMLFFYATGAHLAPLWFIPVLVLIFLTSLPLSILAKKQFLLNFFAIISLFLIVITSRPLHNLNPLLAYFHFLPVYVIGMFICSQKELLIRKNYKNIFLLAYVFFLIICVSLELSASFSVLSKIPLFLYLCVALDRDIKNNKISKALSILADVSFSIYFIHGAFIGIVQRAVNSIAERFQHRITDIEGIAITLLVTALIIVVITLFCLFVKRITVHSRIIIGS
ncbi:surface polysaccharide O-acyltransferase-like enzyme [Raoultella terrigena]|nr:surface polysaccharide O-acyltransferase-like enzyme [Raoultella terrigena]